MKLDAVVAAAERLADALEAVGDRLAAVGAEGAIQDSIGPAAAIHRALRTHPELAAGEQPDAAAGARIARSLLTSR